MRPTGTQHMDKEGQEVGVGDLVERGARKRLVEADGTLNVRGQHLNQLAGRVDVTVMMIKWGSEAANTSNVISTPEKDPIVKRRRQDGEEGVSVDEKREAASLEEGRRA